MSERERPTHKQMDFAWEISQALGDKAELFEMDKWEMRDYISAALSDSEKREKVDKFKQEQRHRREEARLARAEREYRERHEKLYNKQNTPWLSDESLYGEWGLDASDFGMQAWGNS